MRKGLHIPKTWTFRSRNVADNFEAHVNEQLPWYQLATDAVAHVVRHYLPEHGMIYDIGASTGNIGRAITPTLESRKATLIALEESAEMITRYRGPGTVTRARAQEFDYQLFDVAVLFLVLMFLPVADRKPLMDKLRRRLNKGGAIIVFDKALSGAGYFGTVMRRLTISWKLTNGAKPDDIVAKELSLAGVQRPINPRILGRDAIQFFTFGEFSGWVIESPE